MEKLFIEKCIEEFENNPDTVKMYEEIFTDPENVQQNVEKFIIFSLWRKIRNKKMLFHVLMNTKVNVEVAKHG
jgi:hypothetical protein